MDFQQWFALNLLMKSRLEERGHENPEIQARLDLARFEALEREAAEPARQEAKAPKARPALTLRNLMRRPRAVLASLF